MVVQLKCVLAILITGTRHGEFRAGQWMNETFEEDIIPYSGPILGIVR